MSIAYLGEAEGVEVNLKEFLHVIMIDESEVVV
jgi:hypothetical protein